MSFDHSLSGYAVLRKEVSLDGAVEVVKPLFGYFGLVEGSIRAMLLGKSAGPTGIEGSFVEGTHELSFYTSKCVGSNFDDVIKETVVRLNGAAEKAGHLTLQNYDTADLESAVTYFWFGPSELEIARAMFESDLDKVTALLDEYLGRSEANRIVAEARSVYAAQRAAKR